jgi:acetyl-CoA carboxylase carboxyl transferase subunit beta
MGEKARSGDGVIAGAGRVDGRAVFCYAQDPTYLGGSLGAQHADSIVRVMKLAGRAGAPLIGFIESGGARMQEGMFSLMQMPRTTVAVQLLRAARLPYVVVLTNPTTGGVTASYAMLGDIHIAEPGAMIGFAGARVIEQTIRERLPEGFQRAEYLQAHGMVDIVVSRLEMRATLARLCALLTKAPHAMAQAA